MKININAKVNGNTYNGGSPRDLTLTVMMEPDGFGSEVTPEQARRIAAGLNRAAEAVEAHSNAQADVDAIVARPWAKTQEVVMVRYPATDAPDRSPDGTGHDAGCVRP